MAIHRNSPSSLAELELRFANRMGKHIEIYNISLDVQILKKKTYKNKGNCNKTFYKKVKYWFTEAEHKCKPNFRVWFAFIQGYTKPCIILLPLLSYHSVATHISVSLKIQM